MAPNSKVASPDTLTVDAFSDALAQYPTLIEDIDASKSTTAKKTLKELDTFRYDEAPALFSVDKPKQEMEHDDVKTLVEWKLRHGKFRPMLMKLVSDNDPSFVKDTIRNAIQTYRKAKSNPQPALDVLVKLRGIGPATASLLLNVHDPNQVIFFSDEAFYWLCGGGQKVPLKYNAKEYVALREAAAKLQKRLDVSATDVEKVAYVLFKAPDAEPSKSAPSGRKGPAASKKPSADQGKAESSDKSELSSIRYTKAPKTTTKRKPEIGPQPGDDKSGVRRSKRTRA